jgi:micrococcal nuclease
MTRLARIAFIVGVLTFFLLAACETAEEPSPTRTSPSITPTILATPTPGVASGLTPAQVTRVVDGDTIEVEIGGVEYDVRYIGIDTPETVHPSKPVECFGPEASARNKELVRGKTVGLEKDVSETDRFGRLLRYVWVGEEMVNAVLVRDGYAQSSTYPPDVRYQEMFVDLQQQACLVAAHRERRVDADHRELDDVCRAALHRMVDRLALGRCLHDARARIARQSPRSLLGGHAQTTTRSDCEWSDW